MQHGVTDKFIHSTQSSAGIETANKNNNIDSPQAIDDIEIPQRPKLHKRMYIILSLLVNIFS